jgi:hypothetical protein
MGVEAVVAIALGVAVAAIFGCGPGDLFGPPAARRAAGEPCEVRIQTGGPASLDSAIQALYPSLLIIIPCKGPVP